MPAVIASLCYFEAVNLWASLFGIAASIWRRAIAQVVSVQVWGTWGRQFESGLPDNVKKSKLLHCNNLLFFIADYGKRRTSPFRNPHTSQQDHTRGDPKCLAFSHLLHKLHA